jgi:hypothetical protein
MNNFLHGFAVELVKTAGISSSMKGMATMLGRQVTKASRKAKKKLKKLSSVKLAEYGDLDAEDESSSPDAVLDAIMQEAQARINEDYSREETMGQDEVSYGPGQGLKNLGGKKAPPFTRRKGGASLEAKTAAAARRVLAGLGKQADNRNAFVGSKGEQARAPRPLAVRPPPPKATISMAQAQAPVKASPSLAAATQKKPAVVPANQRAQAAADNM